MELDDVRQETIPQPHNIVVLVVGVMIFVKVPFRIPAEYYLVQARASVTLNVMNHNISNHMALVF